MRVCAVPGCIKEPRSGKADLCKMHYHRAYRHGSVDALISESGLTVSNGRKYRSLYRPRHPMAAPSGKIYEHRFVLYEKIGPGTHPCHWCGTPVRWIVGKAPGMLTADHVDGHGDNNDPTNLVPACQQCNTTRAQALRAEVARAAGWWSNHDTARSLTSYATKHAKESSN